MRWDIYSHSTLIYITRTVEHSYNKPEIPGQSVCYKQEFVISGQFPMRYCSTRLRLLLCYIKKYVIEEFVIRVFHCMYVCMYLHTVYTDVHMILHHYLTGTLHPH